MRTDPYRERARELCVAAGGDPDSRIGEGRGQPAWCLYRDAARRERLDRETRAASAEIANMRPQLPQFQNSPLKVFGKHEEATIAQMRNCMAIGNVVSGVICADGHLGYAQPVGGVIAYEKQISISGVGFDIGCFTGDTKVFTLDGKSPEIKDLIGREFHVLASRPDGTPMAATATATPTRRNADLVCVTLDNGQRVRCTPDHQFMLRDGTFCSAGAMVPGQSLMPFYKMEDEYGYVLVRNNKAGHPQHLHWIVARSGFLGPFPKYDDDEIVIHHKNYTPGNNDPRNLEFMPKKAHDTLHAAERNLSHTKTAEFQAKRIAAIKAFWARARLDPVFMKARADKATLNLKKAAAAGKLADNYASAGERGRSHLIKYNQSGASSATRRARALAAANNHKVVSVERLSEREDVYCLRVPEYANFALDAGVFVHNCGNMAVRLDVPFEAIQDAVPFIARDIAKTIAFGVDRTNDEKVEHELFDDGHAWVESDMESYRAKAVDQLGTVGSGNHYVDLMRDEDGWVWIGVHFGSRGLGHTSAKRYLKSAGGKDGINVPPALVDEDSELGRRYIAAMELAGRYAYAGREWVVERVRRIIGGNIADVVHNHHNYCIVGDAIIPTPAGPRRMQDLAKGDEIYAFDETHGLVRSRIIGHWSSGAKDLYEIRTFNRSIRVSETHPIQIIISEAKPHPDRPWFDKNVGRLAWKKAGDLIPGDIVVCAEGYYDQHLSIGEEKARLIGAFLGDGWLRSDTARRGYSLGLAIGAPEEEHTTQYGNLLRKTLPNAKWRIGAPGSFGITTSHRDTYRDLVTLGCAGMSNTKRVPIEAFSWCREEKLALLAGYIDADGSVAKSSTSNHGRCKFLSVNAGLISDLRELAIGCSLRVTPVRTAIANTNYGSSRYWTFSMSANSVAELPIWHASKRANVRTTARDSSRLQASNIGYLDLPPGTFAQTVQSVEKIGNEEVFDLTVDHPSHAFIADGIVVHNCWRETHGGRDLWVVRKGATPAFPGQRGFVGGSMGDDAVILEGVDSPEAKASLYSTVHGAGRLFGRKEAKRRFNRQQMDAWLSERGVVLVGADLDESPMAYRRLPDVLAEHAGTVKVLHTLRPFAVAMAGEGEFDPFKE